MIEAIGAPVAKVFWDPQKKAAMRCSFWLSAIAEDVQTRDETRRRNRQTNPKAVAIDVHDSVSQSPFTTLLEKDT